MILTCSCTIHCFLPNSVRKDLRNFATGSADLCRSCSKNRWKSKGRSGSGSGGGGAEATDKDLPLCAWGFLSSSWSDLGGTGGGEAERLSEVVVTGEEAIESKSLERKGSRLDFRGGKPSIGVASSWRGDMISSSVGAPASSANWSMIL